MKYKGFFVLLAGVILLGGCASSGFVEIASSDSEGVVGAYTLAPLDPIKISLLGIPKEKDITTIIDENGEIMIPYIDKPIKAAGLTISELEKEVRQVYVGGAIYKNVTVNIQTSAKTYYMEGEVRQPHEYPLPKRITLLQAIAAAGGYTDYADKEDVIITRGGKIIKVNAKKIEKNPEMDIPIEAGDRIKVDRSWY